MAFGSRDTNLEWLESPRHCYIYIAAYSLTTFLFLILVLSKVHSIYGGFHTISMANPRYQFSYCKNYVQGKTVDENKVIIDITIHFLNI
jgi:hypothetical protein